LKKLETRGSGEAVQSEREGKGIAERVKSIFGKVTGDKGSGEEASVIDTKASENKEETKPEGYEEVVKELSKQSGVSEEEVSKQLEGLDKSVLEEAIALLSKLFAQGGQIVNCATDVLSNVIDGVSKGVLALQALLVDIATGAFVSNNKANIETGSNQLMTSMDAMSKVLQSYGKEAVGYAVDLEGFLSGLKEGESGIVWVNEDHYITVTKKSEDSYSITDSNVNEGKAIILSAEAVKSVLSGNNIEAKDESGNTISVFGYKAVGEDGKVKVLTESEGVMQAKGAEAISAEKMKEIAGAKTIYKEVTTRKTVEKTKTVEMTGYRQETRSREVSGTRTVKNADGTTSEHSYSYTVTYTVTVEYKYKVEVKYTEEIEITESIAVEVPDEDDAAKKKAAEDAAKKAWEDNIAKMKQKEFEEKLKEASVISAKVVSSTEEAEKQKIKEAKEKAVQEMSNDEFKKKVDKGELEITKVTVTDVQGEGLTQAAKNAFMNSVNAALNATGATFNGNYASQALNAMTNTAVKIMNGTMAAGQVLKDLAFNVLGLSTGKAGVVVDQNAGTMTQYGTDGTKTIVTVADGTDYKKLQQTIDDKGFTAANDWLKTNGNFKSETKYDAAGSEIYTAKNIGYEPNNHAMAIEYDFKQAYNDQVYFTNVNAGDKKVVIENFHTDASRENAMVYSVGDGAGTKQKTSTGLEFTADVQSLDRVTQWSTKTVNGQTATVAKSVDFVGGKDGKASAFEEAVLGSDGSVSITRYDLNDAYYNEKQDPKSGGSGGSSTTLVDEYKNVLSAAENIKITDKKDLYSGFEYVDNSWIDTGKIQTYSYSTANPQSITKHGVDIGSGDKVSVTTDFIGSDWRYNLQVNDNAKLNVQYSGSDGKTYSISATAKGKDWTNLGSAVFDKNTAKCQKYFDGVLVMTSSDVTFSYKDGFSGGSFANPSDNTAVYGDTIITGVDVSTGKAKTIDGAQFKTVMDGVTYSGTLTGSHNIKNWTDGLSFNSNGTVANVVAYGMYGNTQMKTSFGITFKDGKFGGGVFDASTINANSDQYSALAANGAWVTGVKIVSGEVNYTEGANYDYTDANGVRYVGTLKGTGKLDNWTKGLNINKDGTVANTVAYSIVNGKQVRTSFGITFDAASGAFGVKFDVSTINAHQNEFAVLQDGVWITGIKITSGNINYVDGAQYDVTVNGVRYVGTLKGSGSIENWSDGLSFNTDGTVANVVAYGMLGDTQMRTSFGVTFKNGKFGGAKFDAETINAHKTDFAVLENGAWITGIEVASDGVIKYIDGAGFDYTDENGVRYVGTLKGSGDVKNWTGGLTYNTDNTLANTIAYGIFSNGGASYQMRTSFGITFKDGKFGGVKFDTTTINANKDKYSVLQNGAWITGVEVAWDPVGKYDFINYIDGAQVDVTSNGVRYIGTLTGKGRIENWTNKLSYNADGTVANFVAYGMFSDTQMRTSFGITFDKTTKTFGGVKFDVATINEHGQQYSALSSNGAWITGIKVASDGTISYIDGAGFDYTDSKGVRYVGTLSGAGSLNKWTEGLTYNDDNTVANTVAYGKYGSTQVRTTFGITFDKETGVFDAKFDASTINANKEKFAALQDGVWITVIEVSGGTLRYIDGAQYDVTVNGVRYMGALSGTGKLADWTKGLKYNSDGTVANAIAYGTFANGGASYQMRTSFGIKFDKNTKTFGGVVFNTEAINANKEKYSVLQDGVWITGVEVKWNAEGQFDYLNYIDGAQIDVTVDGVRYVGTLSGSGKVENWADGVKINSDGTVANFMAYGMFGERQIRTTYGITFNKTAKTFGVTFDASTINAHQEDFAILENGAWITGIKVASDGTINYIDGASFDYTDASGVRYVGTLKGTGSISDWTKGLRFNTDGTVKDTVAYGTFVNGGPSYPIRTSYGIKFSNGKFSAKFDADTINANKDKYAVLQDGVWITGITVQWNRHNEYDYISYIDGAQVDVTVNGVRYVGTLSGTGPVENWTSGLKFNADNTVSGFMAYGMFGEKQMRTSFGITFNKTSKTFGGVKFDITTINANKSEYAVMTENGAWITGINIASNGTINYIDGASFDYTDSKGVRYVGTLSGTGSVEKWMSGLSFNNDGTVANTTAYGTFVNGGPSYQMRTSFGITFDKKTGAFGSKFDAKTINANKDKYSAYDAATGTWITGIEVAWDKSEKFDYLRFTDGAQIQQGNYSATLRGGGKLGSWKSAVNTSTIAYSMEIDGVIVTTKNGVKFNTATGKFSGGTFADPKKNTAIVYVESSDGKLTATYITGIKVNTATNKLTYIDGATVQQGNYTAKLKGTGNVKDWKSAVNTGSLLKYGTYYGYTSASGTGVSFNSKTGLFSSTSQTDKAIKNKSYSIYQQQKQLENLQNLSTNLTTLQSELAKAKSDLNSLMGMGHFSGAGDYYRILQTRIKSLESQIQTTSEQLYNARLQMPSGQQYTAAQQALTDYVNKKGYGNSSYGYYAMQYDPEYQKLSKAASEAYSIFNAQTNLQTWQDINNRMNLPASDPNHLDKTEWRVNLVNEYMDKYQQAVYTQLNMDYNGLADTLFAAYSVGKTGSAEALKADFIKTISIGTTGDVVFAGVINSGFVPNTEALTGTYNGTYDLHVNLAGAVTAQMTDPASSTFALNNYSTEKIEVKTDYQGYITNIGVTVSESGFSFSGSFDFVNTKAGATYTEINLQTGTQTTETGGVTPKVNTSGVIDQSIAGQTTLSGLNSVLTFNSGTAVIIGEGTTAWSGSKLQSAGGIVKTQAGNYTFSGGTWVADATAKFTFDYPMQAQTNLEDAFKDSGLSVTGLEKIDYTGIITGNISSNAMTMLDTMMRTVANSTVPQDAINATVTGDKFALTNGAVLAKGASFNISLQTIDNGQKVLAFKALSDLTVSSYDMPEGWTSAEGTSFKNIKFATGEFITIENILSKSGVTAITNENTTWNSLNVGSITLNLKSGSYSKFGDTYFELAGNGNTVSDGQNSYETSELVGSYNGTAFTILAGAKISLGSDGSISVIKGDVYVKDMYVQASSGGGTQASGTEAQEADSYFRGTALGVDKNGNIIDTSNIEQATKAAGWKTTGVFFNYSDSTDKSVFFSQGSIFADKSTLNAGSWHYNYGLVIGTVNIKFIEVDGVKKEVLTSNGTSASMVKWSADGSRIVMELNASGISSIYQITDGNVQGTKSVYFATENIQGYNVVATDKNGQYIIKEIVGKDYINEVILATGENGEKLVERETLNGTIKCTYDKTTGEYSYSYPEEYTKSYTFFDNNLHKDGTEAKTWDTGDGNTVFTINEGDAVRAFGIEDSSLNEIKTEVSLGSQDVLQSGELEFTFVYEDGKGKIISKDTITIQGTIDGKSFPAEIGYDSSKGGLYLVNEDEIKVSLSNDEAWEKLVEAGGVGHLYEQQLSSYNTYEEYLSALLYGGTGTYNEETGMYVKTEADVDAYLEDMKNGKGGEDYAGMTRDEFLHENQLFTRAEFEQAKKDGAKYAMLLPDEMMTETRKAVLSDVVFSGEFDSGTQDQYGNPIKITLNYQIMGSSIDANGLSVTARLTLTGDQQITMKGDINVPDGGEGSESESTDIVNTRVTATVVGKDITLGTTGDYDAQFDVTFNAMVGANDSFKPTFSNFIAGTELTLVAGSKVESSGNQTLTNSGVKDVYGVSYNVNVGPTSNVTFLLKKDTKLYELAGAVAKAIEDGDIKTEGVSVKRTMTDQAGNTIVSTIDSKYIGPNEYYPETATWKSEYKPVTGNNSYVFGSGTYNDSKNRVEFGFWEGHINTNVADVSISKNWFAGTLQAVGGFLGSIVGFVADPFVQAGNAIADLFSGEFSWEKLGNAFTKTLGAFTGAGWVMSGVDIAQNGWDEHFSKNQILNWSASMMFNKKYEDVVEQGLAGKAAISGLVGAVAIAVTICTGGLGAAAFIPALGGTSAGLGAVIATGLTVSFGTSVATTASIMASALVTAYFASQAAMNAYDGFKAEGVGSLSAWLNVGAGILSIAFPVRIGGAAKTMSASLQAGATTASQVKAVAGALKEVESISKAIKAGKDVTQAIKDLGKTLETLQGMGLNISGLQTSMTNLTNLVNMAKTATDTAKTSVSIGQRFVNLAKSIWGNAGVLKDGIIQGQSGLLGTLRNAQTLLFGGGIGGTISSSLTAWAGALQGFSSHMFSMFQLNVAMNSMGALFGDGLVGWSNTWKGNNIVTGFFKGVFEDIRSAGQQGNIIAVNPGQSLQFGLVMFLGMPLAQGIGSGLKGLFSNSLKEGAVSLIKGTTTGSKLANAVEKIQQLGNNGVIESVQRVGQGAFEEWFKEGALKRFILQPLGVSPEMSEVFVEFLSPDGAGVNFTNNNYAETVSNSTYSTSSSDMGKVVNNINGMLSANGLAAQVSYDAVSGNFIITQNGSQIGSPVAVNNTASLQNFMTAIGAVSQNANNQNFHEMINSNMPALMEYNNAEAGSIETVQNLMLAYSAAMQNGFADITTSEGVAQNNTFIQNVYNAAQIYKGLNQDLWSSVEQAITAKNITLNAQAKASVLAFVAKNSDSTGRFSVQQVIDTIASRTGNDGLGKTANDLATMITLVNSQLLYGVSEKPVTSQDVVNVINSMDVKASKSENIALLANLGINYARGNSDITNAIVNKINALVSANDVTEILNNFSFLNADGGSLLINLKSMSLSGVNFNENIKNLISELESSVVAINKITNELESASDKVQYLNEQSRNFESNVLVSEFINQQIVNENRKAKTEPINDLLKSAQESLAEAAPGKAKEIADKINELLTSADAEQRGLAALLFFNQRDLLNSGFLSNQSMQDMIKAVLNGESVMQAGVLKDEYIVGDNSQYLAYINYDAAFNALAGVVKLAEKSFTEFTKGYTYKTEGDNLGQVGALIDVLSGGNLGIFAEVGFGKTFIAGSIAWIRSYMGKADMDIIVQNDSELNNHMKNSRFIQQNGANIYKMGEIVNAAQNNPMATVTFKGKEMTALERFEQVMSDDNAIRLWLDQEYGFLRTTAEENAINNNDALKRIKDEHQSRVTRLTLADEIHKFMESAMSYIKSSGESATLLETFNEQQKETMKNLYEIASKLEKGKDFNVDTVNGKVIFTESGKAKAAEQIKNIEGATTGKIQSMVQAIQDNGKSKYMLSDDANLVGADAVGKLVTMGGGQAQPSMILQDYSYAYAAAVECLGGISQHEKALGAVRKSNTSYGTSRSGLFYGQGQYVGMSGTLSHVDILSDVYGMPVERFGTQKNFELRELSVDTTIEKFNENINKLQGKLDAVNGKGKGPIYDRLIKARQDALNDAKAGLEVLNQAIKEAKYESGNGKDRAVLEILETEMKKNAKGPMLKAYVAAYEALNTISIVEFTTGHSNSNGDVIEKYIDDKGNITEEGIERIAKDILEDAGKGLNQLFVSMNGDTLNAVKAKLQQIMEEQGSNQFEIVDINGTTAADEIYNKDSISNKESGYIISGAKARIVLANERGGMGLDYTGDWSVKSDSSDAVYSFMHQTFGRNGRHMNDAESFTRTIYANMSEIEVLLQDIKTNGLFEWLQGKFTGDENIEFSKYDIFDGMTSAKDIDSLSTAKKIQLAKMYKGLMQSNSSLIFGMIDTLNDVAVTSALANLINMEGISEQDKAVIRKIQDSVFNNHTDGDINVGRGELLNGKDQVTNSLESQRQKAMQIFNEVVNSVQGEGVRGAAQAWLSAWEDATYNKQQSANNTNAIVDLKIDSGSVQAAFDIIYGRAEQIMPYFGSYSRGSTSDIKTLVQAQKALDVKNIADKGLLDILQAKGSPYVIGDNLTFDGRILVNNYMVLSGKSKTKNNIYVDDDLAKALMMLLMQALGLKFNEDSKGSTAAENGNINNVETAITLTANNITVENLIEFNTYVTNLGINTSAIDSKKILEILKAQHDINITNNIKAHVPSAMMTKLIELEGVQAEKATVDSLKQIMPSASDELLADLAEQYNQFKTVEKQTQKALYGKPLTAKEKVAVSIDAFRKKHPALVEAAENAGKFVTGMVGYMLFKAPAVTAVGKALGVSNGSQRSWQVPDFSNAIAQAVAFMIVNIGVDVAKFFGKELIGTKNNANKTDIGVIGNILAASVSVWDFAGKVINAISTTNNTKKLEKAVDTQLNNTELNAQELKVRLAVASINDTDQIIKNIIWLKDKMPDTLKNIKLSDVKGFEQLTALIEIAARDSEFKIALDSDVLKLISTGQKTVLEIFAPDFAEKLGIQNVNDIEDTTEKLIANAQNKNIFNNISVAQINEIIQQLDLAPEYAMALLYPAKNPYDMQKRLESVEKSDAEKMTLAELGNDNNFVYDNGNVALSDALKKSISVRENKIDTTQESESSALAKTKEFVVNCAEATVEALGKVIALVPLTKAAVEMNPFAEDARMVAGLDESLDKATTMGELREKTGFEYRTLSAGEVEQLGTPFVAYINSKDAEKPAHVITVTKVSNGMVTYSDNTVKDGEISIGRLYEMGFEGFVLASEKSTVGTKVSSLRENTEKVIGKEAYDKLSAAGKKLANEIVNGVTKPQDMNTTLSALLAICKDGDAVAAMLGYASMKDAADRGEVTAKYYEKVGQVLALKGVSEADKQVSIKLLAMARDVIFMASGNEKAAQMLNNSQIKAEDIISMLVVSKAVNQNVIVKTVAAGVTGVSEEEFVIDIAKLQQAVKSKTSISNAKKALEDLAAMLSANGRGSASMPMSLMKLSDVRAVAQAA
jgi:hypothetical protein